MRQTWLILIGRFMWHVTTLRTRSSVYEPMTFSLVPPCVLHSSTPVFKILRHFGGKRLPVERNVMYTDCGSSSTSVGFTVNPGVGEPKTVIKAPHKRGDALLWTGFDLLFSSQVGLLSLQPYTWVHCSGALGLSGSNNVWFSFDLTLTLTLTLTITTT